MTQCSGTINTGVTNVKCSSVRDPDPDPHVFGPTRYRTDLLVRDMDTDPDPFLSHKDDERTEIMLAKKMLAKIFCKK
jgi:hypothetical protein